MRERTKRAAGVAMAAAVVILAAGCGGGTGLEASGPAIETDHGTATPYGQDATQVWVLRPHTGEPRSIVVYLHGYGAYLPFEWHLEWMNHLLENGSTVLFPRYQVGGDDPFAITPFDLAEGLATGFAAIDYDGEPVVAAGFSLGATLAFVYAARAAEWGVPAPRAVYSIFPVHPALVDLGLAVSRIDSTKILLFAGEDDDVVGQDGARELLRELAGHPRSLKEFRLVRTTEELFAHHDAPTLVHLPVVRRTFWEPLDELVEWARAHSGD